MLWQSMAALAEGLDRPRSLLAGLLVFKILWPDIASAPSACPGQGSSDCVRQWHRAKREGQSAKSIAKAGAESVRIGQNRSESHRAVVWSNVVVSNLRPIQFEIYKLPALQVRSSSGWSQNLLDPKKSHCSRPLLGLARSDSPAEASQQSIVMISFCSWSGCSGKGIKYD
jgi:hypothetical protein